MPIFRSARPYITAYGFQHLMCWMESWEAVGAGRVHCVEAVIQLDDQTSRITVATQTTQPASRLPKTQSSTLSADNHM